MTLHDAIEMVLYETGSPMTAGEIAQIINKRNLYSRQDNRPVPASQISARIQNYTKKFTKELGKIKLVQDDIVSLKLQRYKNEVSYSRGKSTDPKIIIETLKDLDGTTGEDNTNSNFDLLEEPSASYGNEEISSMDKLKISYRLIDWFLSQNFQYEIRISDQFVSFLAKLPWLEKGNHSVMFSSQLSNHFFIKIAYENPQSNFVLETSSNMDIKSKSYPDINNYVEKLFSQKNSNNISRLTTGVFIPPFLKGAEQTKVTNKLLDELNFENPKLDKAIIVLPASTLAARGKADLFFKQEIVRSKYLDSVVQFPSGMFDNAGISVAVFILEFKKSNNEVFLLDATSVDTLRAAEVINQKQHLANISDTIFYDDIVATGMNLTPGIYVYEPEELVLEPGYKLCTIKEIILDKKIGIAIPRKKLYQEGEFKVIRTSEIKEDSDYLNPENIMLGVDHDEVRNIEKNLALGGVILSGFNKKLKANILPQDQSYIIGTDTYWMELDNEKVLDLYFLQEIRKEYVQKQVEQYSKGLAIMRISLNDLLNIKIIIPSSLEKQKDVLLSQMQKKSREVQIVGNNNSALDFIHTLEHSLRQPASSLGNDLHSLRDFINNKIQSGESLSFEEPVVPVFNTDTPEQIAIHSVSNTLERMQRMVTDLEYILTQAGSLVEAKASPILEIIDLRSFLNNFVSENHDIKMIISGNAEITADRKQMRILFNNLIANAKKHGFGKDVESPTIWMEVKNQDKFHTQISIRNNGKALPNEFTTADFLAKGKSTDQDVGSGFGGYLIGQILKNHNGDIHLVKDDFSLMKHNVEFLITLPL